MQRKFLTVMFGLLLATVVLVGSALAAVGDGSVQPMRIAGPAGYADQPQIRFITPTPTPPNLDDYPIPVRSEAGRDFGLIIGATFLVLIVIGGVIFSLRWRSQSKARD